MKLRVLILHKIKTISYLIMTREVMGKPKMSCWGNGNRINKSLFISVVYRITQVLLLGTEKNCTSPSLFDIKHDHMTFSSNEM